MEILLALALLPVIILLVVIYQKDKYQKEPLKLLIKTFVMGCLCCIPAIILEGVLSIFAPGEDMPVLDGLFNGFVVAGFSEELCKLVMLYLVIWKSVHFDEYFDGIVYAVFISLGFAGVENVMYVFNQSDFYQSISTGVIRALMSVPGHFLFAVAMGYYFALAKFRPAQRMKNLMLALFVPVMLHGTFDALLMIPEGMGENQMLVGGVLFIIFIWFDIRLWKFGAKKLRHLQELSKNQNEKNDNNAGQNWQNNDGTGQKNQPTDPFANIDWNV